MHEGLAWCTVSWERGFIKEGDAVKAKRSSGRRHARVIAAICKKDPQAVCPKRAYMRLVVKRYPHKHKQTNTQACINFHLQKHIAKHSTVTPLHTQTHYFTHTRTFTHSQTCIHAGTHTHLHTLIHSHTFNIARSSVKAWELQGYYRPKGSSNTDYLVDFTVWVDQSITRARNWLLLIRSLFKALIK